VRMHSAGPGGWQPASPATTTGPAVSTTVDPNITAVAAVASTVPKDPKAVVVAVVAVRVASAPVGLAGLASLVVSADRVGLEVPGACSAADDAAASVVQVAVGAVTSARPSSPFSPRNPATATS